MNRLSSGALKSGNGMERPPPLPVAGFSERALEAVVAGPVELAPEPAEELVAVAAEFGLVLDPVEADLAALVRGQASTTFDCRDAAPFALAKPK